MKGLPKYGHGNVVNFYHDSVCCTGWIRSVQYDGVVHNRVSYKIQMVDPASKVMNGIAEEALFKIKTMKKDIRELVLI